MYLKIIDGVNTFFFFLLKYVNTLFSNLDIVDIAIVYREIQAS